MLGLGLDWMIVGLVSKACNVAFRILQYSQILKVQPMKSRGAEDANAPLLHSEDP